MKEYNATVYFPEDDAQDANLVIELKRPQGPYTRIQYAISFPSPFKAEAFENRATGKWKRITSDIIACPICGTRANEFAQMAIDFCSKCGAKLE